ncbi:hypothetical protein KAX02_02915 [candidate division WOR-3 bacterium]|nr:hypothetical protein [candidate division WOR-3 bacterium]
MKYYNKKGKFHIDLIIGKKYDDLLLGITCKITQLNPIRVIYPNGRDTTVNPENLNDTISQLSEKLSNRYSANSPKLKTIFVITVA